MLSSIKALPLSNNVKICLIFSFNQIMVLVIQSDIKQIDEFLGRFSGGIIIDIFGSPGVGKTQLALQICTNSIIAGGQVLFQDTKGEFRPERIVDMIKAKNCDKKLLENIKVARITNSLEQISYLSKITSQYSLIIIDNITDLFSFEFEKDEQTIYKNTLFMKYMHDLSLVSIENNIPIIIINAIRTADNKEKENLEKAISPFTHVKIHLSTNGKNYSGELLSINKKTCFSYIITEQGVIEQSQSI